MKTAWLLLICMAPSAFAQAAAITAADYFPADPDKYCIKSRTYTYGRTGSEINKIVGTVNVPYKSGTVTGVVLQGGLTAGEGYFAFANDGSSVILPLAVKDVDGTWIYASKDCDLSGPPAGLTLIPEGFLPPTGVPVWGVKGASCLEIEDPDEPALFKSQQTAVAGGITYGQIVVFWDLNAGRPYVSLDFNGRDRALGIALPTRSDTGNHAAHGFVVFAKGLGPVAGGRVDSSTGVLETVWEVTAIDCTTPNPSVFDGGVVNAASFDSGHAVAPGSLVSILGFDIAKGLTVASSIPLPVRLDDISITFNGIPAPLLAAIPKGASTPAQINAQVPWNVLPEGISAGTATMVIRRGTVASPAFPVQIGPLSPGVFAYPPGAGKAIAVLVTNDERNGALAAPVDSIPGIKTFPARAGDTVELYATGLGAVDIPLTSGYNSVDQVRRTAIPAVLLGNAPAEVLFAGLSPWFVGVNQVNIRVPQNAPKGTAVPLQIRSGAYITADKVTIAIE